MPGLGLRRAEKERRGWAAGDEVAGEVAGGGGGGGQVGGGKLPRLRLGKGGKERRRWWWAGRRRRVAGIGISKGGEGTAGVGGRRPRRQRRW